jgi:hypothetical protein
MFAEAGDAYVKLAEMPGVNRRSELDRAHTNYDSAYLATQNPSRLCWALKIAERVVREGEFNDADQASYWRDTVDDDLRRLQADARTTQRANCRFDKSGSPRALVVATLTDDDFAEQPSSTPRDETPKVDPQPPQRTPETRRWRAQTASGAVLTGLGLGFVGALAGVLELQSQHASAMRRMSSAVKGRGPRHLHRRRVARIQRTPGRRATAPQRRDRRRRRGGDLADHRRRPAGDAQEFSRKFDLQPHGGPLGGGALLRVRF